MYVVRVKPVKKSKDKIFQLLYVIGFISQVGQVSGGAYFLVLMQQI